MRVGLNPYGLTWLLGLQGRGTARMNPQGRGLDGFHTLAEEIDAGVLEIFDPWLREMDDDDLRGLAAWLAERDIVPVVSSGVDMMGPMESAFRSARLLEAKTIRLGLTPVLCGARNAWGTRWDDLVARVREVLAEWGPRADDEGRVLAIENHQDFTSGELVAFCESVRGIGITFDTGNAFPVAEAPLDFTRVIAAHVRHLHLKDYRAQFTDEGFQLIRCAIGDGAVPFVEILKILEGERPDLTAVLEPGLR
jgi:sugar phosphate isomerase/epimerase